MTFRPQLGPPASARQLQELLELLKGAGYADFRSARGPLGFTQRQGTGKFTRDEADALIDQLQGDLDELAAPTEHRAPEAASEPRPLSGFPTEQLVSELRHRGWRATKA